MSFFDHLNELRNRLVWALVGAGIAIAAVYYKIEWVTNFLLSPYLHYVTDPAAAKPTVLSLGEGLAFDMKLSVWAGLVLAAPWLALQLWLFIRPALKPAEIRWGVPAFIILGLLFIAGVAFAFRFMLPPMFQFFIDYNRGRFTPVITISSLWELESRFMFWTGLIFEMPVIFFVLGLLGLTGPLALAKFWRFAIVLAAMVAAFITPTTDPVNMMIMMSPIIALYGVSILTAGLGALLSGRHGK